MPKKEKPDQTEEPLPEERTGDEESEEKGEPGGEPRAPDDDPIVWTKRFPPKPKR